MAAIRQHLQNLRNLQKNKKKIKLGQRHIQPFLLIKSLGIKENDC